MNHLDALPVSVLADVLEDKWLREKCAFQALLPGLMSTHKGLFVAIHDGQVVESGSNKLAVGGRAYARFGYVPIFVTLVTDRPLAPERIPSPRTLMVEKS